MHVWDFVLRRKCSREQEDGLRYITGAKDRDWIEDQSLPPVHEIVLGLSTKQLHQELQENPDAVHTTDAQGRTALDWATARAQSDHMKLLIHHGSNCNAIDSKGHSMVLYAVDSNNPEALRIILRAGASADPVIHNGSKRSSPLTAIRCNAHSVLKLFLDRHTGFLNGASLLETIHRYADEETISILQTRRLDPRESGTLAPSVPRWDTPRPTRLRICTPLGTGFAMPRDLRERW